MKKNKHDNTAYVTEYLLTRRLVRSSRTCPYEFRQARTTDRFRIYSGVRYLGQFRLLEYSRAHTVYFYDFNISPPLRGKGIGKDVFHHILGYLFILGYRNIVLQVSDANMPAFAIYKNNGFRVLESVIVTD